MSPRIRRSFVGILALAAVAAGGCRLGEHVIRPGGNATPGGGATSVPYAAYTPYVVETPALIAPAPTVLPPPPPSEGAQPVAMAVGDPPSVVVAPPAPEPEPVGPLFDRLGGRAGIEGIVDGWLRRVHADRTVSANEAVTTVFRIADQQRLRRRMADHLSQATGGPYEYAGRGMKTAHRGLRITKAEWDASNAVFAAVLDARGVRARDRDEFLGVLAGLEGEIVGQ